jgi:hypothetical protein
LDEEAEVVEHVGGLPDELLEARVKHVPRIVHIPVRVVLQHRCIERHGRVRARAKKKKEEEDEDDEDDERRKRWCGSYPWRRRGGRWCREPSWP